MKVGSANMIRKKTMFLFDKQVFEKNKKVFSVLQDAVLSISSTRYCNPSKKRLDSMTGFFVICSLCLCI
jgi:hypothetical protein